MAEASKDPKISKAIDDNNGVDKILGAMNQHPTDKELQDIGGEVLAILGTEKVAKEVKSQYNDFINNFDSKDKENVENFKKANIYLSNLMSLPAPEDESLVIKDNQKV